MTEGRIEIVIPPGTLLIRADANSIIGIGHVMRCMALAQTWRAAGGQAIFLMSAPEPKVIARLNKEEITVVRCGGSAGSVEDAKQTIALAKQVGATWIILDGYNFGTAYQKALRSAGSRVLYIDDLYCLERYHADLILNQNIHADADSYRRRCDGAELLMGSRYVLLRQEFQAWRDWRRKIAPTAKRVLVTLGGGDHNNVSQRVLQSLCELQQPDLEVKILVGLANPHRKLLGSMALTTPFSLHVYEAGAEMPELMAWADIAISAGGSTCWELAFMGLPSLLLIMADNQRRVVERLDAAGVAIDLGNWDTVSHSQISAAFSNLQNALQKRSAMSEQGRRLVDGEGCRQTLMHLLDHENSTPPGAP